MDLEDRGIMTPAGRNVFENARNDRTAKAPFQADGREYLQKSEKALRKNKVII